MRENGRQPTAFCHMPRKHKKNKFRFQNVCRIVESLKEHTRVKFELQVHFVQELQANQHQTQLKRRTFHSWVDPNDEVRRLI